MSYHERRAIVSIVSSVLTTVAYFMYMFQPYLAGSTEAVNDPRFWASTFLVFFLVSMVLQIFITIAFNIHYRITANEAEPSFSDERDQLIELKATRNACYTLASGVILSMVALAVNLPLYMMFVVLFCSGLLSSVVSDLTQFHLYKRGA